MAADEDARSRNGGGSPPQQDHAGRAGENGADRGRDADRHAPGDGGDPQHDTQRSGSGRDGNEKNDDDAEAEREHREKSRRRKHRLLVIGGPVLLVVIVLCVAYYFIFMKGRVSTDDAYTDGIAVPVAAKVAGYVRVLAVTDNETVHAGQLLLQIDPRDYEAALDSARGKRKQIEAQLTAARLQLEVEGTSQQADIQSAQAARERAAANLREARNNYRRQQHVDPRATTQQRSDEIAAQLRVAQAQMRDAEAQLRTAKMAPKNIAIAQAKVQQLEGQAEAAAAQVRQAELKLGYTRLVAPIDARVTKRNVEEGQYVQVGAALMSLVSPKVWITANFKETQLTHMEPGQPVHIAVDAYPQLDLHGHVDSIQAGSGARFSAFPPENATGNFVKIVRRVPVKILIDRGLPHCFQLPLGLSAEPTVDER